MLISSRQGGADLKLQVLFLDIDNTLLDFDAGAGAVHETLLSDVWPGISAGDVFGIQ